jgi:hypothetical protein
MKYVTAVILLSLFSFPISSSSQVLARPDLEKLFDPIFASQMEKLHIPGATVAVVQDGKVVFAKGYGVADVETKTPVVGASDYLSHRIDHESFYGGGGDADGGAGEAEAGRRCEQVPERRPRSRYVSAACYFLASADAHFRVRRDRSGPAFSG